MVKIHVYEKDGGHQVEVKIEGPKLDTMAELSMVMGDILKRFDPLERFALLMSFLHRSRED